MISNYFITSQNQLDFQNFKRFGDSSMKHQIVSIDRFTSLEYEFNLDLTEDFQKVAHQLEKGSSVYGNITDHGTQGGKMISDGWRKSQDKEAFGE
ncbi:hypothetical protein O181_114407 [Austropuccinia psidii MF-1]|uniref:Uncharacterized protein n=1 Tax=Austropuccinia psidii MF-1 TaxID=1389203 RepID=A0A9Q3K5I7_9BASI|nr:hypothetical protein [Austropuccinia psidii MF-1]